MSPVPSRPMPSGSDVVAEDLAAPPQLGSQPATLDMEQEVLAAAVQLSRHSIYRRYRRTYRRWARELTSGIVTGQEAADDAVEELDEPIQEQHELAHDMCVDHTVRTR